jgi:sigma-B regulation protein RsbU (phosphoserine phosphatase)
MFVALFYGIVDQQNKKVFYTNAGQPLPLICRDGQLQCIPQLEQETRFPLGLVDSCNYQQNSFKIESGDTLVFYTDGILETMNNYNDSYDSDRFYSSVLAHSHLDINEMTERLVADMNDYRSTSDLNDDVTLVIVRIK